MTANARGATKFLKGIISKQNNRKHPPHDPLLDKRILI